ncbi:MAG: gliding motility-associated C-terminal domain-containing protein [Bacteroidales bacterium]|jgi:gliding motility-associated-like protein|nr:gliding motility-associated C-terminal domain-containing protein [Bacteroidales bacterium]
MKSFVIILFFVLCVIGVEAQVEANFSFDGSRAIMCYTAGKDTRVDFRNTSTCNDGACPTTLVYVWDFGDNSAQTIKKDKTTASHSYTADGQFSVLLQVINTATIPDSISNTITHVELDALAPATSLMLTFRNTVGQLQTVLLQIPDTDYSSRRSPRPITVYSPLVSSDNFVYSIRNDNSEKRDEPIESFAYQFEVNTAEFRPFDMNMWTYYWTIFKSDEQGNPTQTLKNAHIDSLRLYYTFPAENFSTGYVVQLKIALDSSKFEYQSDVSYYNLENCVASQAQVVPVMDYFFTEATRRNPNPLDRTALVPNIFTPGGGDENEVFFFDTNGANIFSVRIFNSWGNVVYSEESTSIRWDGKNSAGMNCPSGVYYYVIQSNEADERHERGGFIHLFRQN